MSKELQRRMAALETRRTAPQALMRAEQYIGEPGIDPDTVQLAGGERMHIDDWRRRYPDGVLITIDLGDDETDESNQTSE